MRLRNQGKLTFDPCFLRVKCKELNFDSAVACFYSRQNTLSFLLKSSYIHLRGAVELQMGLPQLH